MSEWKSYLLEELGDFFGGVTAISKMDYGHGYPFLQYTNVYKNPKVDVGNLELMNVKESDLIKRNCLFGDIFFTASSEVEDEVAMSSVLLDEVENLTYNGFTKRYRLYNFETLSPYFARYLFRDRSFRGEVYQRVNGDVRYNISQSSLGEIPILLPPLPEQRAIASVLSSLDDKIDLLHRQNETLEKMAETLFRQWFVEEADESWEFTSLEKYVTCFNGVSYKSSDLNPSNIAMLTLKSFARDGGFRLDGFKEYTGKYKEQHVVNEGDLVVAHTDITQDAALIGNPIMVIGRREYQTLLISMDLVKVVSNHDWLSNEFLYYQMKSRDFKQHCLGYSNGSTVLHLSKQAVPSYEFSLPPKELIAEFTSQVKSLIEKAKKNIGHIRNIEELRDTLLPKLMSGEVRVNYE